jgi:hypothetical protein
MSVVSAFGGAQPITPGGLVELGHTERTTDFTTTQTAFSTTASHNVFSTDLTVVCDGGPVLVEFFVRLTAETTSTAYGQFALNLDGVENARCATSYGSQYVYFQRRITPSAGSHTFNVCPYSSLASTLTLYAGAGGSATAAPMFLRVSKIVQQNDGLKPFWTPPLVTQLPTNPTVGDTVIYSADATNGVYWNLYYDGQGSYPWKYVGGPPLYDAGGGYQTISSTSYVDLTGVTVNTTLAGDYDVRLDAQLQQPNGNGYVTLLSVSHAGGTLGDYTYPIVYAPSTSGTDNGASRTARILGLTANNTLQGRARVNAGTGYVGYCRLTATPVRVAA